MLKQKINLKNQKTHSPKKPSETSSDKPKPVRRTKRPKLKVLTEGRETEVVLGDEINPSRLPKKKRDDVSIKTSAYYMNNREIFINFINSLFQPYKDELSSDKEKISCEKRRQ